MLRRAATHVVEGVCLALIVVVAVDIFLGVFSRYALGRTFTWYDEVARACFVWMVFLGAAVGVRRGAHYSLAFVATSLPPRLRRAAEAVGALAVIAFAALLMREGWALVELGRLQRTPVIGLSKSWIYLAVPVGGALMILYALPGLARALRAPRA